MIRAAWPYLHLGGDEAHNTSHADYAKMVDYATARVAELGKTVVGWNEYASTALPQDDAVVQLWTGNGAAVANAVNQRGAQVILSPANKTYFPQKQDGAQPVGGTWACGGACTLENAYSWDPAKQISGISEADVLGVEGAFWGEFIRGVDQAQFYSFPRVLAVAEAGWTPQEEKNQAEFLQRVGDSGGRMTLQSVNFFPTSTVDWTASAAPTVSVTELDAVARAAAAPGTANIDWHVTAPTTSPGEVTGVVTWSDGETEDVTLSAERGTDIADMTMATPYSGQLSRVFTEPGVHTAVLEVSVSGEVIATSEATVGVALEDEPVDPVDPENPVDPEQPVDPENPADSDGDATAGGDSAGDSDATDLSGALATTGSNPWPLLAGGLVIVALGTAMAMMRRSSTR